MLNDEETADVAIKAEDERADLARAVRELTPPKRASSNMPNAFTTKGGAASSSSSCRFSTI